MSKEILKFRLQTLTKLIDYHDLSLEKEKHLLEAIEKLQNYIKYADLLDQKDQDVKLLIPRGTRGRGLNFITNFVNTSKELIIIDPYFFAGKEKRLNHYINEIKRAINFQNLESLIIIYDDSKDNSDYKTAIIEMAQHNDCHLKLQSTSLIHDRIWIKDKQEAILVGSSFGGVGKRRLSFIVDLPNEDLKALLEYLSDNNLL